MSNPFTLSFGKKPAQFISRITQTNEIVENFMQETPSTQIYMLTGVRGSGKTVLCNPRKTELFAGIGLQVLSSAQDIV